ncbi:hypothetical protein HFD88_000829 [Aspergillus terreus]|nr:hypothetical protein HFD88_000829 [Aspergillus terreus]
MTGRHRSNTERRLPNPLRGRTPDELEDDVRQFYERQRPKGLADVVEVEVLVKGALVAQDPKNLAELPHAEQKAIRFEHKAGFLQQTKDLKVTILTTACAAIIQGWQQSTINASSPGWKLEWGIENWNYIPGLIDAAPWISGSIIGTWLSDPLQEGRYGRRPALLLSAIVCAACVIGSARCESWQALLACRLILGIGIGAKASIAPVFAAEVAVDHLRGRLLMMWQVFDTFGIFVGFACVWVVDQNWRVLLGTAAIPALILLFLVFLCPESPRFLIRQGDYAGAFTSLRHLRGTDIQAARDLYYIHSQLQVETASLQGRSAHEWWKGELYQEEIRSKSFPQRVWALFVLPRNRRACLAAFLVMASQQLCGPQINVLSFYSSTLFGSLAHENGANVECETPNSPKCNNPLENTKVVWLNFGFGLANFLFTIPAYRFIDWRGRRLLLLISLGGMFFTLAAIAGFFRIQNDHVKIGLVAPFAIVIFTLFYGIGAGPVPFTFSAEVFPLAFREVGMSFSVMVNFLGLGLLVLFVPALTDAFGPHNGQSNLLFLFTGLNALAFILVFFLVPSGTARVSLEDMDAIFSDKTSNHISQHISGVTNLYHRRKSESEGNDNFQMATNHV